MSDELKGIVADEAEVFTVLKELIYYHGLGKVIEELATVCDDNAEHLRDEVKSVDDKADAHNINHYIDMWEEAIERLVEINSYNFYTLGGL